VQDVTGKAIEEALLGAVNEHPGITVLEHHFAIELITAEKLRQRGLDVPAEKDCVLGLYVLNNRSEEVETYTTGVVLLATGGIGQVYQYTTNPPIATGDGIAMAYRAGVEVVNMEFIQFHPTAFYSPGGDRFLISEAVRGEGAILRNLRGEAFMSGYDERGDLAPRDIVARAIDSEMKRSGSRHVWLDVRHLSAAFMQERFPTISQYCTSQEIDLDTGMIPVVPAAHYLCGGVKTELDGSTSLSGLYACGEVACTGLHGANRLASNSLLEAVVIAKRASLAVASFLAARGTREEDLPPWVDGDLRDSDERVVLTHNRDELRQTLWDYVSIVRTNKRLQRARTRIRNLQREIDEYYWNFKVDSGLLELRNLIEVAGLVVECALQREESRGLHYSLDYPKKEEAPTDTAVQLGDPCLADSLSYE
jgi:L-aspartate oxidase